MRQETRSRSTLAMLREQVPQRPCPGTKCGKCLRGTWWVLDEAAERHHGQGATCPAPWGTTSSSSPASGRSAPASPRAPARSHASFCGRAPSENPPVRRRGRTRSNTTWSRPTVSAMAASATSITGPPTRRPASTTSRVTSLSGTPTLASSIPRAWSSTSMAT
jgi:hypothetical protein